MLWRQLKTPKIYKLKKGEHEKNKYNFEGFDKMKFNILQDFVISVRSFRKNLSIPPAEKIDIFIEENSKYYEFIIENSTLISKLININAGNL